MLVTEDELRLDNFMEKYNVSFFAFPIVDKDSIMLSLLVVRAELNMSKAHNWAASKTITNKRADVEPWDEDELEHNITSEHFQNLTTTDEIIGVVYNEFITSRCLLKSVFLLDKNYRYVGQTAECSDRGISAAVQGVIDTATAFKYQEEIAPRQWKIQVRQSIMSRVNSTKLSLDKRYLVESPLFERGVCFRLGKEEAISIWKREKSLMIAYWDWSERPCINSGGTVGMQPPRVLEYPLHIFDERIDDKSIQRMLKSNSALAALILSNGRIDKSPKEIAQAVFSRLTESGARLTDFFTDESYLFREMIAFNISHMMNLTPTNWKDDSISEKEIQDGTTKDIHYKTLANWEDGIDIDDQLSLALKLFCALNSPELRSDVRKVSRDVTTGTGRLKRTRKIRKWVWGTDKVRYIYPQRKKGSKRMSRSYTVPHLCRFYIKNKEKYSDYDMLDIGDGQYQIIKWRSGSWRGSTLDTTYTLGKQPRNYSRKSLGWLRHIEKRDGVKIKHAEQGGELRVELGSGRYYLLDGFCAETNTAYEFHGDVWHGNPDVYSDEERPHPHSKLTARELYERTIEKERVLSDIGFNVVSIWEKDWDQYIKQKKEVKM